MNPETWQIVIGMRGWVWVGMTKREGDYLVVRDARVIRKWGTTRGLAQIANSGPTADTKIDDPAPLRVHVLALIGTYEANAEAWTAWATKEGKTNRRTR